VTCFLKTLEHHKFYCKEIEVGESSDILESNKRLYLTHAHVKVISVCSKIFENDGFQKRRFFE